MRSLPLCSEYNLGLCSDLLQTLTANQTAHNTTLLPTYALPTPLQGGEDLGRLVIELYTDHIAVSVVQPQLMHRNMHRRDCFFSGRAHAQQRGSCSRSAGTKDISSGPNHTSKDARNVQAKASMSRNPCCLPASPSHPVASLEMTCGFLLPCNMFCSMRSVHSITHSTEFGITAHNWLTIEAGSAAALHLAHYIMFPASRHSARHSAILRHRFNRYGITAATLLFVLLPSLSGGSQPLEEPVHAWQQGWPGRHHHP